MYPKTIPPEASQGEKKVFAAFQRQLSTGYTVIYHLPFQEPDWERILRDREIDFVLGHAEFGILVIEVKGGGIRRYADTGRWTTTDRWGRTTDIRDPFEQAKDGRGHITRALERRFGQGATRRICFGHAVAFPDTRGFTGRLPFARRESIMCQNDLQDVNTWAQRAQHHYRGDRPQPRRPIERALAFLVEMWGRDVKFE